MMVKDCLAGVGGAEDTIFALSSGLGKAGVAVFRLSGPDAFVTLKKLSKKNIKPRHVVYSHIFNPIDNSQIDDAIIFTFCAPHSFTGEDMAEIQTHGSVAVINLLIDVLTEAGLRPAEAGEFTQRAFRNGKLDLAQAEALADLIDSETIQQQKQAMGQFGGALSALAEHWRTQLIAILAPLEASIDFPDEEGVPEMIEASASPVIKALLVELNKFLETSAQAQRLRAGVQVVLLGPPNAGKSSLLNKLAGSDVAIVSSIPGTTRDALEVRLDLAGVPVTITDTAGLREGTNDEIEREGMRRARDKASRADLRVGLLDGTNANLIEQAGRLPLLPSDFLLLNKADLGLGEELVLRQADQEGAQTTKATQLEKLKQSDGELALEVLAGLKLQRLSLKTGEGFALFLANLTAKITELCGTTQDPRLTRVRHVHAVEKTVLHLKQSLKKIDLSPELAAEDVRLAARHLGAITGLVDVEEVLGEIFSSFCIGK